MIGRKQNIIKQAFKVNPNNLNNNLEPRFFTPYHNYNIQLNTSNAHK